MNVNVNLFFLLRFDNMVKKFGLILLFYTVFFLETQKIVLVVFNWFLRTQKISSLEAKGLGPHGHCGANAS